MQAGQIRAAQRDHNDRHRVDIDRHNGRVGRILRQHGLGLVDLVAHIGHGLVQIGAERELHNNHGQVFRRGRGKRFQTRKAGAGGLERSGHLLLNILRTGTRVGRIHDRDRQFHIRHERKRQRLKEIKAEHDNQYVSQYGHHVVLDTIFRQFHPGQPSPSAASAVSAIPSAVSAVSSVFSPPTMRTSEPSVR